jgi:hypothetical protein
MVAQMDTANRAKCFALRNPPGDQKKTKLKDIVRLVTKLDGSRPSLGAVAEAANSFGQEKKPSGRPAGLRKTTKAEDTRIFATFKKLRPPGHGVDSRKIHNGLPKNLKKKVCRRTVRNRLAEKGVTPQVKLGKQDFKESQIKNRLAFARTHEDKNAAAWKGELQAVGDLKDFTYYPKDLRAKFLQLRAPWTYMTKAEKKKPEFQRPKRWFPKKDWKRTQKQKVFGLTTSNGRKLCFLVPKPWTSADWAKEVKSRVGPFLKRAFPNKRSYQILLDGEKLLHAPAAKAAMGEVGVTVLPKWPKYSPDLNPQENVWAWAEERLREKETDADSFKVFQKRALDACGAYPFADKLVGGMAKRVKLLQEKNGGNIGK